MCVNVCVCVCVCVCIDLAIAINTLLQHICNRTELQPSAAIHGEELDTSIAAAAVEHVETRVAALLRETQAASSSPATA